MRQNAPGGSFLLELSVFPDVTDRLAALKMPRHAEQGVRGAL